MGECPFCGGSVETDVLVNGGRCPHCLIEIPGEDTPTDPGEAAQAVQEAEDNAARQGRTGPLIAVGVAGVLLVGGGLYAVFGQSQPEPITIEMNEFNFAGVDAHQDLPVEEEAEEDPKPAAKKPSSGGSTAARQPASGGASGGTQAAAAAEAPPTGGQVADAGTAQLKDPMDLFASPASKGVQAIELCSMGEIDQAVRGVMRVKGSQLRQCYNRALKTNDSLKGTWDMSFEIQSSGKTAAVSVTGRGVAEAGFEDCLSTQIKRWTFPPICEAKAPQVIQSPLKFGT